MTLASPPDVIQSIADKLVASGVLPSGSTLHYPSAADTVAAPFGVISATGRRSKIAEGIPGFFSGQGSLEFYTTGTIGATEALADNICDALMADVGLLITDAEYDLATTKSQDDPRDLPRNISITFSIGIGA